MMGGPSYILLALAVLLTGCTGGAGAATDPDPQSVARWYRGNLHTHSLWSDGDDYPEMIIRWYKDNGYDFVAMSDHNTIGEGEKWVVVPDSGKGRRAFEEYRQAFPADWVETRVIENRRELRLKTYPEFHDLLQEPGRFLIIQSEEISDGYDGIPVHVNATNIQEYVEPQGGESVLDVMQRNVDAVLEQRARTGQDIVPHVNHPNFVYAVTAEDLIALEGEPFFEVYNGHPLVHNHGDDLHPSTERLWDVVLAHRLEDERGILYGLATDDAHHYFEHQPDRANAGRGWVMVRAESLATSAIIEALERGDFYASTGVVLDDVEVTEKEMRLSVQPQESDRYLIQFIGTRQGFDRTSTERLDADGRRVTSRHSDEIGTILAEAEGPEASYTFEGDELYVRVRVVSTRLKTNGVLPDEPEMAWTQPVQPAGQTMSGR